MYNVRTQFAKNTIISPQSKVKSNINVIVRDYSTMSSMAYLQHKQNNFYFLISTTTCPQL